MGNAVSIRIAWEKSTSSSGAISHAFRIKTPDYVDAERTHENVIVVGSETPLQSSSIRADIETYSLEHAGRKWQSNSATVLDGIITYGKDANIENKILLDKAAKQTLQNIIKESGMRSDSLLYLVRHEDEARTHYHFSCLPQLESGVSARRTFNRTFMSKIQDIAATTHSEVGLDIVRGKPKSQRIKDGEPSSATIHRSVRELHSDLPKEIDSLKNEIKEFEKKTSKVLSYYEKTKSKLEALQSDSTIEETKLKRLQKRAAKYEARIANYNSEIDGLKSKKVELEEAIKLLPSDTFSEIEVVEKHEKKTFGHDEIEFKPMRIIPASKLAKETERRKDVENRLKSAKKKALAAESALKKQRDDIINSLIKMNIGCVFCKNIYPDFKQFEKYNCEVMDFGHIVFAQGGTKAQIAAALYSVAKENGWSDINFSCSDGVAEYILKMAKEDNSLGIISFTNDQQQSNLESEKKQAIDNDYDDGYDMSPSF